MGILDKIDNFYRKTFVSHSDKYKEKHGAYLAKTLNKIFNEEYDPYEFPNGLTKSDSWIPAESELNFLNELPINTISLCENIALICFGHNYGVDGGIDSVFKLLSEKISKGSQNKFSENFVYGKLKECSTLYKNVFNNNETFPHFLHLYFNGWDVETEGHLDNIFKTFYLIQGNVLFISRHSLSAKNDIIIAFFKEHNYRLFTTEEDIYEEKKIRQLSNNTISQTHIKLLDSEMTSDDWSYMNLLEIIKNVAEYSGYNEIQAAYQYKDLLSRLDKEICNWNELAKLGMLFFNFSNYSGEFNSAQLIKLTGIIHRTEMTTI